MNSFRKSFQMISVYVALGFFITVNPQNTSMAAWSSSPNVNSPVCTATAQQSSPHIISDGSGGAIAAWEDTRNVHFDIYAQRIGTDGNILWKKDGVPVCTAEENQNKLRLVSDGAGGVIITWQDIRGGKSNSDIYAQHIDAAGNIRWTADGLPVCTEVNAQNSPCIITDGDGGAIIIWQDFRTNYADLYAQRISKSGEVLWKKNGVLVCGASDAQSAPVAVEDGAGGGIVVWQDFRRSFADIYGQRIDGSGNLLWERTGVPVCMALGHESYQVIVSNGAEGAIVAWIDTRNGNNDIFAQQVDGNGAVHWLENGIPVCVAPDNQTYPAIASDGSGGAFLSWWDKRKGDFDIYAQHIDLAGNESWEKNGLAICIESGIQNSVDITGDGQGGMIVVWNDNRLSNFDIFAQRIDRKGAPLWKKNGVAISTAPDTQCFPILTNDNTGGAIIVWQDFRHKDESYWDIYAQRVYKQGQLEE